MGPPEKRMVGLSPEIVKAPNFPSQLPCTSSFPVGVFVPMPTLPVPGWIVSGLLSFVPTKLVAGFVPVLPVRFQLVVAISVAPWFDRKVSLAQAFAKRAEDRCRLGRRPCAQEPDHRRRLLLLQ